MKNSPSRSSATILRGESGKGEVPYIISSLDGKRVRIGRANHVGMICMNDAHVPLENENSG